MSTFRLLVYIVGIVLAITALALFPFMWRTAISIFSIALLLLTFLGWQNVVYAVLVGIIAGNPTENIPEGEEK